MRIVLDYRPALVHRTGVGEFAHRLAEALVPQLGSADELVLFSGSWKQRLEAGRVSGAAVTDVRVPNALLNLLWHRAEWPPVEWLAGPADIAQSMHPLLMPSRRALPFVSIYDLYFLDRPEDTAAEIRRDYVPLAAAHARRAAGIVTISAHTARAITERLGVEPSLLVLCPPGAPAWTPRTADRPGGPLLFVGNPEPRKNLPALLSAYARLLATAPAAPDLVLAGRPPAPDSPLATMLRQPPWATRVRHIGYVDDEAREALYKSASLLVLPSRDEGFGMTVVEAMTAGVPVVSSNRGALPEVAGGAALLVDPDDEAALAHGMESMLVDLPLRTRLIAGGIARARQFTWRASAATLLEAYREADARRRSDTSR